MSLDSIYVLGGLALLVIGAEGLVRGSTGLALRLGMTSLAIGLTVVAFGTGSPELVLAIEAARAGNNGLALGNVVGSNISNIALVLGVAALVRPMRVRPELIRRELPLMIAVTLFLWVMLIDGRLSRPEGLVLVVGAVAYTVFSYFVAKRDGGLAIAGDLDDAIASRKQPVWLQLSFLMAGLAALLVGASLLLEGAASFATGMGVSQVVIGLTIVAVGTSLPELAASIASAVRGEADVALGNVIGSNVLNILAVLGVAVLIHPFEVHGLRTLDLVVLVSSPVMLLLLMSRGSVLNRWEGAGLLAGYVAYMYSLVR